MTRRPGSAYPSGQHSPPPLYAAAPAPSAGPRLSVAARTPQSAQFTFRSPPGVPAIGWYVDDAHNDAGCEGNPYHAAALVKLPLGRTALAIHSIGPDLVCSKATTMVVVAGLDDRVAKRSHGWANDHDKAAYGGTFLQSHAAGLERDLVEGRRPGL